MSLPPLDNLLRIGWPPERWRVLDTAHKMRNLAEYEGTLEVEKSTVTEPTALVARLLVDVGRLVAN